MATWQRRMLGAGSGCGQPWGVMINGILSAPKISTRRFIWCAAGFAGLGVAALIYLCAIGWLTVAEGVTRGVIIVAIQAAAVWAYSRVMGLAMRTRAERMPFIHVATGTLSVAVVYVSLSVLSWGTQMASGVQVEKMWCMIVGMTLAAGGWARRVGETLHCAACEYELRFGEEEVVPARCPECGGFWLLTLKRGRRVKSPRMVAAGVGMMFFGLVVLNPIFYLGGIAPYLPTPVLCGALYLAPLNGGAAWRELEVRSPSAWWTLTLGERVIGSRGRESFDSGPSNWFAFASSTGAIPPEMVERFFREGFIGDISVPQRVKAGEPFEVSLRVSRAATVRSMGIIFGGYSIDGREPVGRQGKIVWAHEMLPGVLQRSREVMVERVTAARAGEVRVRAVLWVVYTNGFWDDMKWQEDGTPTKPTGAVWFEEREFEATVIAE
ncbi:MAG: hypothetical protein ACT4PL_00935 [Phycisphaerales bacterium]